MRSLLDNHFIRTAGRLVDSDIPSSREFWRARYFDATPAEASDPRPFSEALAERGRIL